MFKLTNKKIKILSTIQNVFIAIVLIVIVSFSVPKFFGVSPYVVLSGSMEPEYKTGSMIYVKSVPASEIEVGDVITYVLNEDLVVSTHRVYEIDNASEGFITKGDANEDVDSGIVLFKNLLGTPIVTVPYLGYIYAFFKTGFGIALAAVLFLLLLSSVIVLDNIKSKRKKEALKRAAIQRQKRVQAAREEAMATYNSSSTAENVQAEPIKTNEETINYKKVTVKEAKTKQ